MSAAWHVGMHGTARFAKESRGLALTGGKSTATVGILACWSFTSHISGILLNGLVNSTDTDNEGLNVGDNDSINRTLSLSDI